MSRIAYLAAAVAAITAVGLGSPALASVGTPARTAAALAGSAAGVPRQVTLLTGDVVTVRTDVGGQQHVSVARGQARGNGRAFQTFSMGPDVYVVPQSAVPYVHSVLDLRLFDVTALAKQAEATSTRVGISYRAGAAHRPIPACGSPNTPAIRRRAW